MMIDLRSLFGFERILRAQPAAGPASSASAMPVSPSCMKPRRDSGPAQRNDGGG